MYLCPDTLVGSKGINAYVGAHGVKLGSESRILSDVLPTCTKVSDTLEPHVPYLEMPALDHAAGSHEDVMTLHMPSMELALPVLEGKFLQIFPEGCHLSLHVLQACGCHILA